MFQCFIRFNMIQRSKWPINGWPWPLGLGNHGDDWGSQKGSLSSRKWPAHDVWRRARQNTQWLASVNSIPGMRCARKWMKIIISAQRVPDGYLKNPVFRHLGKWHGNFSASAHWKSAAKSCLDVSVWSIWQIEEPEEPQTGGFCCLLPPFS